MGSQQIIYKVKFPQKKTKNRRKMTTTEIKQQLCIYDKRNPYYDENYPERIKTKICNCNSCYSGKHQLANELLRVKQQNISMLKAIEDTRLWYVKEGFKALAPVTPLVFSTLLDNILVMSEDKERFI